MTAATITPELAAQMAAWRHDFHRHPELGFEEHRTSARVAELLQEFGLEVHTGIGGTGVVGVLQRGNGTASIGFRADMDALPITETGRPEWRSKADGVMHACGHDGHTSMLLGAAAHLAKHGDFNGRVIFIFQPNEEHGLGASAMIEDGLFTRFAADHVFAMHNIPGMPAGSFATRTGAITASESLFEITVTARGGHAALPHMGIDAILVGAQLVTALQGIVSRNLDPARNGVVSVTEFITDGRRNVLAGNVILKGDARALGDDTNAGIEAAMRRICAGMAATHGVEITVSYDTVFPSLRNDHDAVRTAVKAATAVAGSDHVNPACDPKLFSEDFAHMARAVPGCFMLIGNGTEGASARPLHASDYDFNDAILSPGAAYIATLAEQMLETS
ncbi:MAG: amidohydrolase [Candidatus Puniceispirillaceae bacterium]